MENMKRAGERLMGVIGERDYAHKVIECMALMTARFLRPLLVVEDGSLVGQVSIGDIGKMEASIGGGYPV